MQFSCLLIGQDNLLIECGKYLIERSHKIKWVVTPISTIQTWCEEQGISWVKSLDELPDEQTHSVDYLFSIVNGKILSKEELSIARKASINYHDALLPKYAGVNATTWSLLNDEKEHGITWHLINAGIDKGDMVYQGRFPITDSETALTLNLRCFEEAIKGFTQIVKQLETDTLQSARQATEGRSYYGISHVLPNLGFINWQTDDALSIYRCYRALNFGNYSNNVGTLKLYLKNDFLSVTDVQIEQSETFTTPAGQILSITKEGILVNTSSNPVRLKGLMSKFGMHVSIAELKEHYGLKVGMLLPQIEPSFIEDHSDRYKTALSKEKYWIRQLRQTAEHGFFTDRMAEPGSDLKLLCDIDINQAPKECSIPDESTYVATILLYLYRVNNYENYTLYYQYSSLTSECCASLFSDLLPLSTQEFDSDMTIHALLKCVKNKIARLRKAGTFLNDIFIRQPALTSCVSDAKEYLITLGFSGQSQIHLPKSLIHFDIDFDTQRLRVFHRIDHSFQGGSAVPLLQNMAQHLSSILQEIVTNPEKQIHQFSFLSAQERRNLFEWSIGEYRPLPSNTLTSVFEHRVRFSPHKTILIDGDNQLTYHQLWLQAEKVTAFLSRHNVQAMTMVTIQGFRGIGLLSVTLGILKSGCIVKLIDDNESVDNPVLVINDQEEHSKLLSCEELYNTQNTDMPQQDKSVPKQACLELKNAKHQYNQKQLINYCHWLANNCHLDDTSVISVHENLPQNDSLLQSLAAVIAGASIDYTNIFAKPISHLSMTNQDWEALMASSVKNQNLYQIPNLLLTNEIMSEQQVHQWQMLSPNSHIIVVDNP